MIKNTYGGGERLIGQAFVGDGAWEFAKVHGWERKCILDLLRSHGLPVPVHAQYDTDPEAEPEPHWVGRLRLSCMQVGANDFRMELLPNGGDAPTRLIRWWYDPELPTEITLWQVLHFAQGAG